MINSRLERMPPSKCQVPCGGGGMWRGVVECWGVLGSVGECVVACVG